MKSNPSPGAAGTEVFNPPPKKHSEEYGVDVSVAAAHLPELLLHGGLVLGVDQCKYKTAN